MVKSIKGREVDMDALRKANPDAVAVGNANLNARGDLLGKGGKIIKTREELAREYHNKASKTVKNVPISKKVTDEPVKQAQEVKTSKTVKTKDTAAEKPLEKEMEKQKQEKKSYFKYDDRAKAKKDDSDEDSE